MSNFKRQVGMTLEEIKETILLVKSGGGLVSDYIENNIYPDNPINSLIKILKLVDYDKSRNLFDESIRTIAKEISMLERYNNTYDYMSCQQDVIDKNKLLIEKYKSSIEYEQFRIDVLDKMQKEIGDPYELLINMIEAGFVRL